MRALIVGLDPGLVNSPTGFFAFDPDDLEILCAEGVRSDIEVRWKRTREIADQVRAMLEIIDPDLELAVYCESFVMRGAAGEMLARLTGSFMAAVPQQAEFGFVQNTTVKKVVGGTGKADKAMVAAGVYKFFESNDTSRKFVYELVRAQAWDILDAAAIAITGYLRSKENGKD